MKYNIDIGVLVNHDGWLSIFKYLNRLEPNSYYIHWNQHIISFAHDEDATAFKLRFLM